MKITIKLKGIDKATKSFAEYPKELEKGLNSAFKKSTNLIKGRAKQKAPVDTSRLEGSITSEVERFRASVGSTVKYAVFVHEGTRPHFPPINALRGWARRHGMSPFVVARGIARKGTKPNKFLEDSTNESLNRIKGFFESSIEAVNDITVKKIK